MIGIVSLVFICMVTQVYSEVVNYSNNPANFRCKNGKYITNSWFCDRDQDCGDSSDESFGCSRANCGQGKFSCSDVGTCLPISKRCDTFNDCRDKSDEFDCGDEINVNDCDKYLCQDKLKCLNSSYINDTKCNCFDCSDEAYQHIRIGNQTDFSNCTLDNGKFLCKDKLQCIDFKYTCNGICGCFDCSDETSLCNKFDNGTDSCGTCPLFCVTTPNGQQCACNSSTYETSPLCREIENCTGQSSCSQYCSRYKNATLCSCYEDHHKIRNLDGTVKCRSNVWLETVLFYSTTTKIKMMNTTTGLLKIIQNDVRSTTLTAAKNYLYYVTHQNNRDRVLKTLIDSRETDEIIELDSKIKSLAVDWISGNLYLTVNNSLVVCTNDGKICIRLKCCGVNYVGLAPKFGRMFYTQEVIEENKQLIMKSNMDGSETSALLDKSFHSSTSLAVDEWSEKVYWLEAKLEKLNSASFNGLNHTAYSLLYKSYSNRFSSLERYLYFLKNASNEIYRAEVPYSHDFFWHSDEDTDSIRELFAYNPHLQLIYEIKNPCENSACRGLCLLRPVPYLHDLNYTCITWDNLIHTKDNLSRDDHPAPTILPFESTVKSEVETYSSTAPPTTTTSMKTEPSTSTKSPIIVSVNYQMPETSSSVLYITIGMSSAAFAFSISLLYLYIKNNYLVKHHRNFDLSEGIEL